MFRKHDVSAERNATCEQTGHQNVKTTSFEPKLRPNRHIHAAASCRRFFLLSWFPVVRLDYRIFLTCFLSWERFGSEITDRKQKQVSGVSHHVKGNSIFFSSNLVPGATPWICDICFTLTKNFFWGGGRNVTTLSRINESRTMKPPHFLLDQIPPQYPRLLSTPSKIRENIYGSVHFPLLHLLTDWFGFLFFVVFFCCDLFSFPSLTVNWPLLATITANISFNYCFLNYCLRICSDKLLNVSLLHTRDR